MASSRQHKKIISGMDTEMKKFLICVTIAVFLFGAFSGANLHTVYELGKQQGLIIRLIVMPPGDLSEINV